MFDKYEFTVVERFMRYVRMDTQSDPQSHTHPTSMKQKELSVLLEQELKTIGIEDVYTDEYGYVYATIPSNTEKKVPVVCFCAHIDTAPDCSGTNVVPILHENYDGRDIVLPDDISQVLSIQDNPFLKEQIGHSLITASGTTLLGADDKSGLAIIVDFANYICTYPNVKHGTIKLLFTPDEEVGQGTAKLDLERLGADFAYTLDGGEAGTLEDETFSADSVEITINGVISHPGTAKGKLINAIKIAGEILMALPTNELSPETTEKREGFVHPVAASGIAEKATLEFIIRDFITANLQKYEEKLKEIAASVVSKYPKASFEFTVREQYRNMKEILELHPKIVDYAMEAYRRAGLQVVNEPIRGGTDGSRLSFMGLPCPNLFTGMQAIHSKKEWVGVKDMMKAVEVLVNLVKVMEETV